jgi:hypothetical protein
LEIDEDKLKLQYQVEKVLGKELSEEVKGFM